MFGLTEFAAMRGEASAPACEALWLLVPRSRPVIDLPSHAGDCRRVTAEMAR